MDTTGVEITLLTRDTVAAKFGVHRNTIRNWEKLGLPVYKIGGLRRYDLVEVYKWVELKRFSQEFNKALVKKRDKN